MTIHSNSLPCNCFLSLALVGFRYALSNQLDPNQLLYGSFYNQENSLIWIIPSTTEPAYDYPIDIRRQLWTYSLEIFLATQYYFYHLDF